MNYKEFLDEWNDSGDTIICHTSGSTGCPKIIELPKKEVEASARRTIGFLGIENGSHYHSCISPDYIGGKMMAVRSVISNGILTWEKPSNRPLEHYDGGAIDLLAVVPSQMIYILENLEYLPEIRRIIIGGAKIPETLRDRILKSGLNAWETYGMTETASHIALKRISSECNYFRPLKGIRIYSDEVNRLIINISGWQEIHTNDIVEINDSGDFKIVGRADNVIITGGKKVHPEPIEEILENILDCETLITSEPDDKWGERIVLIIEEKSHLPQDDKILEICKLNLSPEAVPKKIIHGIIPRTDNGKKKRS